MVPLSALFIRVIALAAHGARWLTATGSLVSLHALERVGTGPLTGERRPAEYHGTGAGTGHRY